MKNESFQGLSTGLYMKVFQRRKQKTPAQQVVATYNLLGDKTNFTFACENKCKLQQLIPGKMPADAVQAPAGLGQVTRLVYRTQASRYSSCQISSATRLQAKVH